MYGEEKTQQYISTFSCEKDQDIVKFLTSKALLFEKIGKSRTFIVYDEDNSGIDNILGIFSIGLYILKVAVEFSNRKIKQLDGFSAKINNKAIEELPVILIGQFAKNSNYKYSITGDRLMELCMKCILKGQLYLSGRIVFLECKNTYKVIEFYKKYGFNLIDSDHNSNGLIKMFKVLSHQEIIKVKECA